MGKLVKKAELIVLGTLAIALFSYTHMSDFLSSLDTMASPDPAAYTASAAAPIVENQVSPPVYDDPAPVPEDQSAFMEATSTSEATVTVVPIDPTETDETASETPAEDSQ